MSEENLFIISNAFVLLFHMALSWHSFLFLAAFSILIKCPHQLGSTGFLLLFLKGPGFNVRTKLYIFLVKGLLFFFLFFSSRWHLQNLLSFSFLFLHLSGAFLFLFSIFHSLPHVRLVFWNSIHLEVASDSFSFLINSSWLLVFILYVFSLFQGGFNLYCWKGIHFS